MAYKVIASSRDRLGLGFGEIGRTITVLSALALGGALFVEHILGIPPCPLCLEQRIVYYAAVPLGILAFMLADGRQAWSRAILVLLASAFAFNSGLGVYHAGIEWGWWPGPDACSGMGTIAMTTEELLKSLSAPRVVRCDEAPLRVVGLSLAGYSAILSGAIAVLAMNAALRARAAR